MLKIDASGMDFKIWKEHFLEEKSMQFKQQDYYDQKMQVNDGLKEQLRKQEMEIEVLKGRV